MRSRALVLDAATRQSMVAIRCLSRRGVSVIAGAYRPRAAGSLSKHADGRFTYPAPWEDPPGFASALRAEVADGEYDAVLVSRETTAEIVVENRDVLADDVGLPLPSAETLAVGLDKTRTMEAAADASLPHPRTLAPGELDREAVEETVAYPAVVKPRRSHGREGVSICESFAELERAVDRMTRRHGPVLVQEYVPNGGEVGAYLVYDFDSRLRAGTVQERVRSHPPAGGASTCRRTIADEDVLERAHELLSGLDWQGAAMVEFRVDPRDGEPKVLEINPRLWGSLSLSVAAGVDVPYLLYQLGDEGRCDSVPTYRPGVYARRVCGELGHVLAREDTVEAVRDVLRPTPGPCTFDVVSWDDPLPTVGHFMEITPWPT